MQETNIRQMNEARLAKDSGRAPVQPYTPEEEAADQERLRRKHAKQRMERKLKYNRDRAMALFTGAACVLVALGGTGLSGYHAVTSLGILAGAMALASFLVADLAVFTGAYVDYHEDGTALEWVAMAVKYSLSIILLCCGGLVAYKLITGGDGAATDDAIAERATAAFNKCMERPGAKEAACQRVSDRILKANNAAATTGKAKQAKDAGWAEKILAHPMFYYGPGILGLFAFLAMAVTAKLSKPKEERPREEDEDYEDVRPKASGR